jgi:hypothetical protein
MKKLLFVFAIGLLFLQSCERNKPTLSSYNPAQGNVVVADTIIYNVTLRAFDTTSIYDVMFHKHVKRELLINHIFDGIYQHHYLPFDYHTGKPLNINDIKSIELGADFSRKKVSQLQIKDLWFIDSLGRIQRIPHSLTLGLETYNDRNEFIGHKALFTVKPNYPYQH